MHSLLESQLGLLEYYGTIRSWRIMPISEDGREYETSPFRNSERLIIEFPDGKKLTINTTCSGCLENSSFA